MALTLLHVLRDDVDGLFRHHGVEPHQPRVLQVLHEVGLRQEGTGGHAALLQVFDGHLGVAVVETCGERGVRRQRDPGTGHGQGSVGIAVKTASVGAALWIESPPARDCTSKRCWRWQRWLEVGRGPSHPGGLLQQDQRTLGGDQNSTSWAEICNHIVTHQTDRSPCGFSHQQEKKQLGWLGQQGGDASGDLEGTSRDRQHPRERRQRPHSRAVPVPSLQWH